MKEEQENSYGHVLKYTGIFGGVQGLNIAISLVRNKIVASLLGPGGMGLASLFNTTVNFISQATNLGISFSAVRHVSELFDAGDEERILHFVKVVRAWSLLTGLIGFVVCIVAGPFLSEFTFSWGDHSLHFILLAPAVALLAITGGETAILKGARKLKALAVIQLFNIFIALLISFPLYYFFNQTGIVPVIVLMAFSSMIITIRYSYRFYPFSLRGATGIFGEGMAMVRLGVAFVLSGVLGAGAEMLVRSYLNVVADLDVVGLYNAGFMLTMTYAGMVFSAMETDYFPRLSATGNDVERLNQTVNRQSEVSLLIISPMLAALIIGLPILIPLLFSADFLPLVGMAQVVLLSMYIRAVYLPIAYIVLARGESWQYLALESLSSVMVVTFVIIGFNMGGLTGTGIGLALVNVLDLIIVYVYAHWRYHYNASLQVVQTLALHLPLGVAVFLMTFVDNPYIYWPVGALLSLTSAGISFYILRQKTSLWNALMGKIRQRATHS